MHYESIDRVFLPVANLNDASEPFERLGLRFSDEDPSSELATRSSAIFVGGEANHFAVELISADGGPRAGYPLSGHFHEAFRQKRGLCAVSLRVSDLSATLKELAAKGVSGLEQKVVSHLGVEIGKRAFLATHEQAGVDLVLVQYLRSQADRYEELRENGYFQHAMHVKRLDHLAAVTPDLEEKTRFWTEVLGVPLFGEIVTPTLVVRQLKIGDAILELLAATTPDSPIAKRAPGLSSMASFEVADLDEAFGHAKAAGFAASDPIVGALPGTRISTIQHAELSGLMLQLLEYVGNK